MPQFVVTIENASGVVQGPGPISKATRWTSTRRLDRAGTFGLDLPGTDPRLWGDDPSAAPLLVSKSVLRCRTTRAGTPYEPGVGIIDQIDRRVDLAGRTVGLRVSGDDLAGELANRTVGFLNLSSSGSPVAVATALTSIMALAPAGWTLDTSTYTSSGATVYLEFAGESVLAALSKVAEKLGEHFRLGTARQIVWLYKQQPSSGVRAISVGESTALASNTAVCLIDDLSVVEDSHDTFTRIYPYGAGNADARQTLSGATWTPPAGYAIDTSTSANYIRHTVNDTANRIDRHWQAPDLDQVGTTGTDAVSAANALALAAYEQLRQHVVAERTYRLRVSKLDAELLPGSTIDVQYRQYHDSYKAVDIDTIRDAAPLVVLETTTEIDGDGIRTTGLTVSTIDRPAPMAGARLAALETQVRTAQAHTQPQAPDQVRGPGSVAARYGGTGQTSYAVGDLLVASSTTALAKVAPGAAGTALVSNGPGVAPAYAAVATPGADNSFSAAQTIEVADAGTANLTIGLTVAHATSGTPAANFGSSLAFVADSATVDDRTLGRWDFRWATATDASRKAQARLIVADATTTRVVLTGETDGAAAMIGVLGAAAVARPAAYTQTYATTSRIHAAYTSSPESEAYTGAADGEAKLTDLNALRVANENLRVAYESTAQVLNQLLDDLQAFGWLG